MKNFHVQISFKFWIFPVYSFDWGKTLISFGGVNGRKWWFWSFFRCRDHSIEAQEDSTTDSSKASLHSKGSMAKPQTGGHSPIKAIVMLKKLIVTAAPLPSLEGSLEVNGFIYFLNGIHHHFGHRLIIPRLMCQTKSHRHGKLYKCVNL